MPVPPLAIGDADSDTARGPRISDRMTIAQRRVLSLIAFAVVLGLDQSSKSIALALLQVQGGTIALPGPLDLTLVMNRSNAFGLVPFVAGVTPGVLVAVNAAAALFLLRLVWRGQQPLMSAGLAVIAAGAVGNAIDRVRFGAVVDFFDASKVGFPFVFNIADASINLGIALILLSILREALISRRISRGSAPRLESSLD